MSNLIDSGLGGRRSADVADLDAVLAARSIDRSDWTRAELAGFGSAVTRALLYAGHVHNAIVAADDARGYLREAAVDAEPGFLGRCHGLLAETYLLGGHVHDAAAEARLALNLATGAQDSLAVVHAQGLLAAALAVNGEFRTAERLCEQAETTAPRRDTGTMPWSFALARLVIAGRKGDARSAAAVVGESCPPAAVMIMTDAVTALGRGWLASLTGDHRAAVAAMESFRRGVLASRHPPLFTGLAHEIEAVALLRLSMPSDVRRLLVGQADLPDHAVCYESMLAGAHIQQGQPRDALRVTERCLRSAPLHCPRTLIAVHLWRAVAHELLALPQAADRELSQGAHLAADLGGIGPMPEAIVGSVDALLGRLCANEPELGGLVVRAQRRDDGQGDAAAPAPLIVQLTERESLLANWLVTELTLGQIARELHLSINTIKTHAKSLYRKLGVSSRQEAADHLEYLGLARDPRLG